MVGEHADGGAFVQCLIRAYRFLGTEPEPRPGLSSGHIPHSFSLPFTAFLQTHTLPNSSVQYTSFLPVTELRNVLFSHLGDHAEAVIQGERAITTSCGSGMTAGVLWLGLKLLGAPKVALYDEVSHAMHAVI